MYLYIQCHCLRLVALDGYDISTIEGLDSGKTAKASEFIKQYNPNDIHTFGVCWSEGLEGTDKRFMPYNGMLGTQQMEWLQETLKASKENQEKVMVLTHIPIHPNAADNLCLLWNYKVNMKKRRTIKGFLYQKLLTKQKRDLFSWFWHDLTNELTFSGSFGVARRLRLCCCRPCWPRPWWRLYLLSWYPPLHTQLSTSLRSSAKCIHDSSDPRQ